MSAPLPALRRSLAAAVRANAERDPGRVAFRFLPEGEEEERLLSWAELDLKARALAARLLDEGARGQRVLLLHPPGLEYVAALVACSYAGAVAVPAYPPRLHRQTARLQTLARDAEPLLALTTPAVLARVGRQTARTPELAALRWLAPPEDAAGAEQVPLPSPAPGALTLLQYTSGSTCDPRGVMLSAEHLLDQAALLAAATGTGRGDRVISWLPPYHDMGLIGSIVGPIVAGAEAVLMPPTAFLQRPARWLRAVARHQGAVTGGPDMAYDLCVRRISDADLEGLDLGCLRVAFTGAERVRPETLERFARRFEPAGFRREAFAPCYGLAEATLGVTFTAGGAGAQVVELDPAALSHGRAEPARDGGATRRLATSGAPLPGFDVRVVDPESGVPCGDGRVGELWVRGPTVASGYWNRPEESERTFRAQLQGAAGSEAPFLRTGDLGFLHQGELVVTGRAKDLLILLGQNLYPEDLERTALAAHPRLRPGGAAAFAVEVDGEERLALALEVDDPRDLPADEILAAVRGALADEHELAPHELLLLPPGGLPRTSSGKVQRGRCRTLHLAGELMPLAAARRPAAASPAVAPPPALVEEVRAAAAEVLGLPSVEADADFFDLGGHSLLATQLVSRLRDRLRVDLPLRAVFEAPTAAALAARAAEAPPLPPPPELVRVDRAGPLPLSHSQERMWLLNQLDPQGAAYNVAGAVDVDGPLDVLALERALAWVVARHEVLRTRYPSQDGRPRVEIVPALEVALPAVDLSSEADPDAAAGALAGELAAAPFDLAQEPLVRARLFRLGRQRHVLAVSLHHVVADGWSMGILLQELRRAYEAELSGRPLPPEPEALQYLDLAGWQRAQLTEERVRQELPYWRRQLEGAPVLELATDRPRSARRSSAGGLVSLALPAGLMAAVGGLAQAEGATPFMVFLAAFQALLHRRTGQTDLVVGVPVANRNQLTAEAFIGTLVNTLPFRVRLSPEGTFAELLRQVREVSLEAFAHQDLPFERMVSELKVERRAGSSPLFPVLFDYQNAPMPPQLGPGLTLRPISFSRRAAQLDLSLLMLDTELGQVAGFEYSTELFEAATVERLAGHFLALLQDALADPGKPVARLRLLPEAERAALLERAAETCRGEPPRERVVDRFRAQAARTPDAVAVVDGGGALDYRQLAALVEQVAGELAKLGVGPGDRVAVCLERSRAVPAALLGVLARGAAYVPLDPRYPPDRLRYVLEDARPAAVITEVRTRGRLALPVGMAELELDPERAPEAAGEGLPAASAPAAATVPGAPDPVAYVMYTSGSTGRPKGAEVTDRALSNFLTSMAREPGLGPSDLLLSVTTISFDIAGLELFLPLVTGARLHVAPAEVVSDGRLLAELLERTRATVLQATPATWRLLIEAGWRGDGRLRILCGGEAMARELADQLLARGGEVWNLYGPTETTIWSTAFRVAPGDGPVPIGFPIDQTRLYVLDAHGDLVPQGVAGELYIGGAGVARGYLGRPELTAQRFLPDPFAPPGARMYRTGDAVRLRVDGALDYLGRLDHQVKLRGHRVELGEIEAVLGEHPAVRRAVVIAREARPGDVRLVAYHVGDGAAPEAVDLRDQCRRRLPEHMVPSYFVRLPAFPLTPNGKLDRSALPAPDEDQAARAVEAVPPRDALEAELAMLWGEVLGVPVTSVRSDFFDLGGHSLLAARLFARIERRLGVVLPLATLLEGPTVEHLAGCIRASRCPPAEQAAAPAPPAYAHLTTVRGGGARPALFCVHGAGGHVLNLVELSRHLGPGRPFYGIQARGVDGTTAPFASIEEMAETYLAEVRSAQPAGPYHLSGYCGGGIVAYEMARRLRQAGEEVASLVIIDAARPDLPISSPLAHWRQVLATEDLPGLWRRGCAMIRLRFQRAVRTARIQYHRLRGTPVPLDVREDWIIAAFLRAAQAYSLQPYAGPLHVVRARDGETASPDLPRDLGWGELAAGGLSVYEVPGGHHSLMQEPNVQVLSALVDGILRTGEQPGGRDPG